MRYRPTQSTTLRPCQTVRPDPVNQWLQSAPATRSLPAGLVLRSPLAAPACRSPLAGPARRLLPADPEGPAHLEARLHPGLLENPLLPRVQRALAHPPRLVVPPRLLALEDRLRQPDQWRLPGQSDLLGPPNLAHLLVPEGQRVLPPPEHPQRLADPPHL